MSIYENQPNYPVPVSEYLRIKAAANYLGVSPDSFRRFDIPKSQISTRICVWAVADINKFVESRKRDDSANIAYQPIQRRKKPGNYKNTRTRHAGISHGAATTGRTIDKLLELRTEKSQKH
jgi:hypothetical protein